ncbi:MAG TPA: ABC transporter ATP-binding protein [Fimbriimonadaceae bacterium]|nr:ABC transporter ATP-binding protein [Fimbriimonadaceae bacterium]
MATTLPSPKADEGSNDDVLFSVEADLNHRGRLGTSRLVVTPIEATRYEQTPAGEQLVAAYPVAELTETRTEQLVDAYAIVATHEGREVELIRSTNARSLQLSDTERRLKNLIEGKPLPPDADAPPLCPHCKRPLGEDSQVCPFCVDRGKTLLRMFSYTHGLRLRLVWGTVLTLSGTLVQIVPPFLSKFLIDNVLIKRELSMLAPTMLLILGSYALNMVVQIARGRNVSYLGMRITVAIRASLFEKLQSLSLGFYDRRNVGSIMSRMTNDTGALYEVLVDGIPVLLQQFALLIGIPIALFMTNARIAPYVIIPVPFVLLAVRMFRQRMERVWSRFWHNWSRLGGTLNGVLQGTRVVKAFHGENREVGRFERRIKDLSRTGYLAESSWATFFPAVQFTMALTIVITWWFGGRGVIAGTMTLGQLTAFVALVGMLQQPLMALQRIIDWSTRALTAAERVFEIMDLPDDIADAPDAVEMPHMRGAIEFQDVHFGYDRSREVLHGLDLSIGAGEMIGLVGHSGAGKSTLINLLMRFYDPTQGTICFDGVDLRKISLDDFRRQVGVVLQENYLFPGSIRYNIAYGRPEATLEEIIEAAKAANAHDFIINFPDGYDTYVGERGQRLSGGERQRIAIARAILHNPRVLILDEATASVDTQTERMIQEALERLVSGRTVVAIAHRLSTLRNADRLIVIDEGMIAEVGTHAELLEKEGGIYRNLVEMQQEMTKVQANFLGE